MVWWRVSVPGANDGLLSTASLGRSGGAWNAQRNIGRPHRGLGCQGYVDGSGRICVRSFPSRRRTLPISTASAWNSRQKTRVDTSSDGIRFGRKFLPPGGDAARRRGVGARRNAHQILGRVGDSATAASWPCSGQYCERDLGDGSESGRTCFRRLD